jgi:hypothetical protein
MKKLKAILLFILMSTIAQAHQPDLSMLMVYQTPEGKYYLQMTGSLVAFENMVDFKYGKNSYKTPEEFKALFVKHFGESFSMETNNKNKLNFGNAKVILGHETKFIAEVLNMPKDINSMGVRNDVFKEMPQNQCILIFTAEKLPKQQFVLSKENNNEIKILFENGKWNLKDYEETKMGHFKIMLSITLTSILLIGAVVFLKNTKTKVLNFNN